MALCVTESAGMSRQRQPSVGRWRICLNILSFVCQKPVQEQNDKVSQAPDGFLLETDVFVFLHVQMQCT